MIGAYKALRFWCVCTSQSSVMLQQAVRTLVLPVGLAELCICCCRPGLAGDTQMTSSLLQSVQSSGCRCCASPTQFFRRGEAGARAAGRSPLLLGSPAVARHPCATSPGHCSLFALHTCPCVQLAAVLSLMSCSRESLCSQRFSMHGSLQPARLLVCIEHSAGRQDPV